MGFLALCPEHPVPRGRSSSAQPRRGGVAPQGTQIAAGGGAARAARAAACPRARGANARFTAEETNSVAMAFLVAAMALVTRMGRGGRGGGPARVPHAGRGGFRPGLRSGPARLVPRPPSPRRGCVYPRVPQRRHITRRPTRPARRRRSPDLRSAPAVCARAAVRVASASPGVAGAGPSSGVSRPCTSAQAAPAAFTPRDASNPLALRPRTPSSCWGHLPRTPLFFHLIFTFPSKCVSGATAPRQRRPAPVRELSAGVPSRIPLNSQTCLTLSKSAWALLFPRI